MKIAVIGEGLSGLSVCWHLLLKGKKVTLFSNETPAASTLAAGLVHPYPGLFNKLNPLGLIGLEKTLSLIKIAENALNDSIILSKGILRFFSTKPQESSFRKAALLYDDIEWISKENCEEINPHIAPQEGIFIKSGLSLDTAQYLKGLKLLCLQKGLETSTKAALLDELYSRFDAVILCTGASPSFKELEPLNIHPVKGQLLELSWPAGVPPLAHSLIGKVYIAMHQNLKECTVGATYEHTFDSPLPNVEFVKNELLSKAIELFPPLETSSIINVKAGLRASVPGRLPIAKQIGEKLFTLTGLGSRGLLYHAHFAEILTSKI